MTEAEEPCMHFKRLTFSILTDYTSLKPVIMVIMFCAIQYIFVAYLFYTW